MDYEFKNKNTNVKKEIREVEIVEEVEKKIFKSKKPLWVWSAARPKTFDNLEDMIQDWIKDSHEKNKCLKTEFISNNQTEKLVIKKSKYIKSLHGQEN